MQRRLGILFEATVILRLVPALLELTIEDMAKEDRVATLRKPNGLAEGFSVGITGRGGNATTSQTVNTDLEGWFSLGKDERARVLVVVAAACESHCCLFVVDWICDLYYRVDSGKRMATYR